MLKKDYSGLFDFCAGPCELGDVLQVLVIGVLFLAVFTGIYMAIYKYRREAEFLERKETQVDLRLFGSRRMYEAFGRRRESGASNAGYASLRKERMLREVQEVGEQEAASRREEGKRRRQMFERRRNR